MFSSIMPLLVIGSAHQAPAWIILAIIFIIIIKIIIFVVFIVSMFSCTTFLFAPNIRTKVWTRKNSTEENFLAISPFLRGEECSKENFFGRIIIWYQKRLPIDPTTCIHNFFHTFTFWRVFWELSLSLKTFTFAFSENVFFLHVRGI